MNMRLIDILIEGRDAPLYHGTSLDNAIEIMRTFVILGDTTHRIDDRYVSGVSLTRSYRYAEWWSRQESDIGVVFELDQAALAARYKIIPWDIYGDGFMGPDLKRNETEEFLVGDISISKTKCVRKIWVPSLDCVDGTPLAGNGLVGVR